MFDAVDRLPKVSVTFSDGEAKTGEDGAPKGEAPKPNIVEIPEPGGKSTRKFDLSKPEEFEAYKAFATKGVGADVLMARTNQRVVERSEQRLKELKEKAATGDKDAVAELDRLGFTLKGAAPTTDQPPAAGIEPPPVASTKLAKLTEALTQSIAKKEAALKDEVLLEDAKNNEASQKVLDALLVDLENDRAQLDVFKELAVKPAEPPKAGAEEEPEPDAATRVKIARAEVTMGELEGSEFVQKFARSIGAGFGADARFNSGMTVMYDEFKSLRDANPDLEFTTANFIKFVLEPRVQEIGGTIPEDIITKPKPGREPASPGAVARGGGGAGGGPEIRDTSTMTVDATNRYLEDKYGIKRDDSKIWGAHGIKSTRERLAGR